MLNATTYIKYQNAFFSSDLKGAFCLDFLWKQPYHKYNAMWITFKITPELYYFSAYHARRMYMPSIVIRLRHDMSEDLVIRYSR